MMLRNFSSLIFFAKRVLLHQFSCVERQQKNFLVEHKHQHWLNVAQDLYFQDRLPTLFWSEGILTATHVINATPSVLLHNKYPFEHIYEQYVEYSHLRVFGFLAFASTLLSSWKKFDPRAKRWVFIGYPLGTKGYKLYGMQRKHVFISHDVVFHENFFTPFNI